MAENTFPCPSPMIDCGLYASTASNPITIQPSAGSGGETTNLTIPFSKAFTAPPFVMAVYQPNNRVNGSDIYVSAVHNVTATQFEVRVGNANTSAVTVTNPAGIKWIAVGF